MRSLKVGFEQQEKASKPTLKFRIPHSAFRIDQFRICLL